MRIVRIFPQSIHFYRFVQFDEWGTPHDTHGTVVVFLFVSGGHCAICTNDTHGTVVNNFAFCKFEMQILQKTKLGVFRTFWHKMKNE